MIPQRDCLFCESTLLELVQERNGSAAAEIDALSESQVVEGDLQNHAIALAQRFELEPIKLLTDKIETFKREAKIDVRHDPRRMISDTRKKVPIAKPAPLGQPRPTDPFLDMAAYESILQTIGSMARVLELNPKAFAKMDEESLRFMLLVPLNIHYEGQATGETFNWEGRTDIIIKVGGRNVFIAECLVWSGAEYFKSKIDQLLGYTLWRDTKTAIVVFNRNKGLSAVLAQIPELVTQHSNCKHHNTTYRHETGFRFVLHHRDDKNRELLVTVLVFDVPT